MLTKKSNRIMFRHSFVSINTFQHVMIYILLDITNFQTNKLNADTLKKGSHGIHLNDLSFLRTWETDRCGQNTSWSWWVSGFVANQKRHNIHTSICKKHTQSKAEAARPGTEPRAARARAGPPPLAFFCTHVTGVR